MRGGDQERKPLGCGRPRHQAGDQQVEAAPSSGRPAGGQWGEAAPSSRRPEEGHVGAQQKAARARPTGEAN